MESDESCADWGVRCRPHDLIPIGQRPMVTRSEAGGNMPPVFGAINARVIAKRPDLRSVKGHLVRVPRTFDIDIAEGSTRVWVQDPGMHVGGDGPQALRTV